MEYLVLGPLEARDEHGPVELRSGRQRALLAVLLLHAGEIVSVDRLVEELWGDDPPGSAEHALEVHVSGLRAILGRDSIETRSPGYRLARGTGPLDLVRFESLATEGIAAIETGAPQRGLDLLGEANGLWRGEPLENVATDVARPERARLEALRDYVIERQLDAELGVGRHREILADLQRLVRQHPLREGLHERLMLALYRSGRQAEALEAYEGARRVLAGELGVEPGPELQGLVVAIRARDKALLLAGPAVGQRAASSPPAVREILITHRPAASLAPAVEVGATIARASSHGVVIATLSSSDPADLSFAHASLAGHRDRLAGAGLTVRAAAHTTGDWGSDVAQLASRLDADLLLAGSGTTVVELDASVQRALRLTPCDVLLVPDLGAVPGNLAVVVPFGGSEHDWLALEIGAWLVRGSARPLWLCGQVGGQHANADRRTDSSRLLADASLLLQRAMSVDAQPRLAVGGIDGVVHIAAEAGLVVAGLSDRWETEGLGTVRQTLAERMSVPVLFARRGIRPGALAPDAALTRYTWSVAG